MRWAMVVEVVTCIWIELYGGYLNGNCTSIAYKTGKLDWRLHSFWIGRMIKKSAIRSVAINNSNEQANKIGINPNEFTYNKELYKWMAKLLNAFTCCAWYVLTCGCHFIE